jgi:hypothetical protein
VKAKSVLLVNLAVLLANFAVAWSTTDSHVRVLRTSARVAHSVPLAAHLAPAAPAREGEAASVPRTRLLKYLARLEELDRLSPQQVAAVCRAFEAACEGLSDPDALARVRGLGGPDASRLVAGMDDRVRSQVAETLRAADVPEGELLHKLVRIVVSSAG